MGKNRELSDIVEVILQATAKGWINKYRVYCACGTSGTDFHKYYEAMVKTGLLEQQTKNTDTPHYLCRATKYGLESLSILKRKSEVMENLKKHL